MALPGRNFHIAPDGKRFVVLRPDNPAQRSELHIVLNVFEELRQRVPID